MARKTPKTGRLEQDVDAILRAQGLELNTSVEKVLTKSRRRKFVPAKKGQRPPAAKKKTTKSRRRPARAKRLRRAKK